VWGGHGRADHLMCRGAREHRCWCGATFNGTLAARRIAQAVLHEIEKLEDFDAAFLQLVNEEARRLDVDREAKLHDLRRGRQDTEREIANIVAFVRAGTAGDEIMYWFSRNWRVSARALHTRESGGCVLRRHGGML